MTIKPLLLPALRGSFGSWIYYSCLIPIHELGQRVHYAQEMQKTEELSKLIQRVLEGARAHQIANYLSSTPERFFNSLVLATYQGDPKWLEVGNFHSEKEKALIDQLPNGLADAIGFLQFNGKERIFAVDGQHRLAGIKRALSEQVPLEDDLIPVLVVGHKTTAIGMRRTRRLFTTLNKTAIPVKKMDIIALDEDDVMAITARRLVETDPRFASPKIAVIGSTSLPANSDGTLTVITNLYDILKRIFLFKIGVQRDASLRFNRPPDDELDAYFEFASAYFTALGQSFPAVDRLMKSKTPKKVTPKLRHDGGGHVLFRPVGLEIITRIALEYAQHHEIELPQAVKAISALPTDLGKRPYLGTIWDAQKGVMVLKGRQMALELCRHMAGLPPKKANLLGRYRDFVGSASAKLPSKVL